MTNMPKTMEENRVRQIQITAILDKMERLVMYRLNNGLVMHGMKQDELDVFENTLNDLEEGLHPNKEEKF